LILGYGDEDSMKITRGLQRRACRYRRPLMRVVNAAAMTVVEN